METAHASALAAKHAGLERAIRFEQGRPIPDPTALRALKQRKLRIKDELAQT